MSFVDHRIAHDPDGAQWPGRIRTLSLAWRRSHDREERVRILSELWPLVNASLVRFIRLHGESIGRVDSEEAQDIASEKSAAFIRSLESGERDLDRLHDIQMRSYLSVLARNGLVDALRRTRRRDARETAERDQPTTPLAPESDGAEVIVRHGEFAGALCSCLGTATPRAQLVWLFRVFLDMPSKTIAAHPAVCMTPQAVDMMFSRMRKVVRECMVSKGFNSDDAPPGTFVALWELLGGEKMGESDEKGDAPAPDR